MEDTLLNSINDLTRDLTVFINSTILEKANSFANIGLLSISIAVFLCTIAVYLSQNNWKKLKECSNRFLLVCLLLFFGNLIVPAMDSVVKIAENTITSWDKIITTPPMDKSNLLVKDVLNIPGIETWVKHKSEGSPIGKYLAWKNVKTALTNPFSGSVNQIDIAMSEIIKESAIADDIIAHNAMVDDPEADVNKLAESKMKLTSRIKSFKYESSIFEWGIEDIFAYSLELAGAIITCGVVTIQQLILGFFKIGFGIAAALSLLPFFEDSWKKWIRGYISILLWGISIAIVKTMCNLILLNLHDNNIVGCVMLFLTSILYILTPTLTVLVFGAEQTMSSLPNQMIQSGAAIYGIANKGVVNIKKALKIPLSNDDNAGNSSNNGTSAASSTNPDGMPSI